MGGVRGRKAATNAGADADKVAYAPRSLQTCATRKQTTTPITTGSAVAIVVHFTLRVSR
jgi:hypothetical protein